jgi:hypothetical protein
MDTLDDYVTEDTLTENDRNARARLVTLFSVESGIVQAYGQVLQAPTVDAYGYALSQIRTAHDQRAAALAEHIRRLGGTPPQNLKITDSLRVLLADVAASLSSSSALAALERCEDHGVAAYEKAIRELGGEPLSLVQTLYPYQRDSHATMRTLRSSS